MKADLRERIDVFGVFIDRINYKQALDKLEYFLENCTNRIIVTPNAEIIMAAQKNAKLKQALNEADVCLPDGIGVVIASKILGKPLQERTTGYDFMIKMLEVADGKESRLFLLGGRPGVAERAAEKIREMFPGIKIAGWHHGYFKEEDEGRIIDLINRKNPDILLVAMGCPKQEKFMYKNRDSLKFKVAMGVGGSLDVLSGSVKRAPVFMQKAGLEWFYRLITQPWRVKRMGALPLFLIKVILKKFVNKTK